MQKTTRWKVIGQENLENTDAGAVIGFWHGRILMSVHLWPKKLKPQSLLISLSPDGQFIANSAIFAGARVIRGSKHNKKKDKKQKGAENAYRLMIKDVRQGYAVCVTPDGPRGPRMRMTEGTIRLCKATGEPFIAMAWATSRRIVFKSWDRFILPLPFGRGAMVWAGPLYLDRHASPEDIENFRLKAEHLLNTATAEADREVGAEIIHPEPLADEEDKRPPDREERV